jgi:hypothetical protein
LTAAIEATLPASFSQRSMWAFALRFRSAHLNEMIVPWRIRGPLRVTILESALGDLVQRHPTLRSRLQYDRGQLTQLVLSAEPVAVALTDVPGPTPAARFDAARRMLCDPGRTRLDVFEGPTLIVRLLRLDADDHLLCLYVHHSMCDGGSTQIVLRDLAAFYRARWEGVPAVLPALKQQYADVAKWEFKQHAAGGFADEIAYWKGELAGLPPPIALPASGTRKSNREFDARAPHVMESAAFMSTLREFARGLRVTPFSVLVAALAVLLRQRTGQDDLLLGVPTQNRWTASAMNFVGYATSLMPLRVRADGSLGFGELCAQVQSAVTGLLAHGRVPLELLLQETELAGAGHTIFPVWCQFQEAPPPVSLDSCGLAIEPQALERESLLTELDIDMLGSARGWRCEFVYRPALFEAPSIDALMADYVATLRRVQSEPAATVEDHGQRLGG